MAYPVCPTPYQLGITLLYFFIGIMVGVCIMVTREVAKKEFDRENKKVKTQ